MASDTPHVVIKSQLTIYDPKDPLHVALLPSLAAIHIACVLQDNTLATFLPPFNDNRVLEYWEERTREVEAGSRIIIVAMAEVGPAKTLDAAGVVMLDMPNMETGPFRVWVEKLLVSPMYRKRGVARILMAELERLAALRGKTLLELSTTTGSPADLVYPRLGYIELGKIPNYGISPADGSLVGETFYYKQIAPATQD